MVCSILNEIIIINKLNKNVMKMLIAQVLSRQKKNYGKKEAKNLKARTVFILDECNR